MMSGLAYMTGLPGRPLRAGASVIESLSVPVAGAVVAVDGDTAVVRVSVEYGAPASGRWRDLWVLRFAGDGRCTSFEEWPFAPPKQPAGH